MTFQAYLDNIEKQTGVMAEYSLSNAYAMAIIRLLRDKKLLD